MLIQRKILHIDPNKKITLIYYDKFKISNLVTNNNFSPLNWSFVKKKKKKKNKFNYPLEDCISKNKEYTLV